MNEQRGRRLRWLLLGVSSVLSLLVLEVGASRLGDFPTRAELLHRRGRPGVVAGSPYLAFTLPRGVSIHRKTSEFDVVYAMNEHGYRGAAPRSIAKPSGIERILVIGDSFTFGWGSDLRDTFVQRIQDSLDPAQYEVINAGYHAGSSVDSYYAYLVREAVLLQPDVVVIALFTGNDVGDVGSNLWLEVDERGGPSRIMTSRLYNDPEGKSIHSAEALAPFWPWNHRVPVLSSSHAFIGLTSCLNRVFEVPNLEDRLEREARSSEGLDDWSRFEISIQSIAAWGEAHDVPLVFVTIPPRKGADAMTGKIDDAVENGLRLPLVGAGRHLSERAYYEHDGHFNRTGNRIVAELILDFLVRHEVVRGSRTR